MRHQVFFRAYRVINGTCPKKTRPTESLGGCRYKDKATATGSIMLCELQGATEEFIFRWNVIFQEHPEVLTDKTCRKTIFELLDRMTNYLKTIKEEKL